MPGTLQEFHFAIITDNNDPDRRGRLKLRCQSLIGADFELPDWVEPENPLFTSIDDGGSLFLPKIGSTVELVVDVHDPDFDQVRGERFLANPSAKWRQAVPTASADAVPLPADLITNYPNRRGFVTPAGHKLIFDDSGSVIIEAASGSKIEMLPDGTIHVQGPLVKVGPSPGTHVALTNGVVLASGVDPFTGSTYGVLGNASAKVTADK